jgi:hypothetical protein
LNESQIQVIELDPFDERNAMDLITKRLEMKNESSKSMTISPEAIKKIVDLFLDMLVSNPSELEIDQMVYALIYYHNVASGILEIMPRS